MSEKQSSDSNSTSQSESQRLVDPEEGAASPSNKKKPVQGIILLISGILFAALVLVGVMSSGVIDALLEAQRRGEPNGEAAGSMIALTFFFAVGVWIARRGYKYMKGLI